MAILEHSYALVSKKYEEGRAAASRKEAEYLEKDRGRREEAAARGRLQERVLALQGELDRALERNQQLEAEMEQVNSLIETQIRASE
jgi:hypothetical protein